MNARPAAPAPAPHAEYRRRARRIRSVFATAPVMRTRALRQLADEHDRVRGERQLQAADAIADGPAGRFARLVCERMEGPVLRYAHRTRLIHEAQRCGIGRFEANLLIAAVQHQAGVTRARGEESNSSARSWGALLTAFCATQGAIAAAVWWVVG